MKAVVIYYSMSGNTRFVADEIAKQIDVDIIEIKPEKSFPDKGFSKFFWGGKSAVMGDEPALMPYDFDIDKYDVVIIGTPIWASNVTPPIRTFVKSNPNIVKKKLAIYTCFSGGGADKAIDKFKKLVGINELAAELILVDPLEKKLEDNNKKIKMFCDSLKG